jgi:hypothetical protein
MEILGPGECNQGDECLFTLTYCEDMDHQFDSAGSGEVSRNNHTGAVSLLFHCHHTYHLTLQANLRHELQVRRARCQQGKWDHDSLALAYSDPPTAVERVFGHQTARRVAPRNASNPDYQSGCVLLIRDVC